MVRPDAQVLFDSSQNRAQSYFLILSWFVHEYPNYWPDVRQSQEQMRLKHWSRAG